MHRATGSLFGSPFRACLGCILAAGLAGGAVAEAAGPVEIKPVQNAELPAVRIVPVAAGEEPQGEMVDLSIPACRGVVWQRFDTKTEAYVAISVAPCDAMTPASVLPKEGRSFTVDADVADGDVVRAVVVVGSGCTSGQVFSLAQCATIVAVEGPTMTVRRAQ